MNDVVLMQVLQGHQYANDEELRLNLAKSFILSNMKSQIPALQIIHEQIQVLIVLKRTLHVD